VAATGSQDNGGKWWEAAGVMESGMAAYTRTRVLMQVYILRGSGQLRIWRGRCWWWRWWWTVHIGNITYSHRHSPHLALWYDDYGGEGSMQQVRRCGKSMRLLFRSRLEAGKAEERRYRLRSTAAL